MVTASSEPMLPVPISKVANQYFLFHTPTISYLRREHHIPGVLIGTLPQSPQQNVFPGLPLQLMPEEARLLVEIGVGYIVDDAQMHKQGMNAIGREGRRRWRERLGEMGRDVAKGFEEEKRQERERALASMAEAQREKAKKAIERRENTPSMSDSTEVNASSLFSEDTASTARTSTSTKPPPQQATQVQRYAITPTTSFPPFTPPDTPSSDHTKEASTIPLTPASYALYRYLHTLPDHTFYISPGLRFGCQYLVYPGDPLRFHSHFLACSWDWDEPIELRTLVGGGRLGTGVKKGFLIGGKVARDEVAGGVLREEGKHGSGGAAKASDEDVRCFCIEWAGM